jgi:hypothetical protein
VSLDSGKCDRPVTSAGIFDFVELPGPVPNGKRIADPKVVSVLLVVDHAEPDHKWIVLPRIDIENAEP